MAKGLNSGRNGTTNAGAKYVGKNKGTAGVKMNASQTGKGALSTGKG